ncbi:MAG: hypothetical protein M8353_03485 [ANME-2 cluster archaeon]|nr:hypothetical protein [ANME-2 cluster archaeon]
MTKLSQEITEKYVREIVKELTKRALYKRIQSLDNKKIIELENKLKILSDTKKISTFKGTSEEISQLISRDGITDIEFVDNANNFFETKIRKWMKLSPEIIIPITTKSILFLLVIATVLYFALPSDFDDGNPVAHITEIDPGTTVHYGTPMTFSGYVTGISEDEFISAYEWRLDDSPLGRSDEFTEMLPVGIHVVEFRAMNNFDVWSEPVSTQVEVLPNSIPFARIEPQFIDSVPGTPIIFESASYDPDENDYIAGYTWHIDGNVWDISENFIEINLPAGNHEIQLMVKDSHDVWSGPVTAYLEVRENRPPSAEIVSIEPGTNVIYGTPITLVGSGIEYDAGEYITGFEWLIDNKVAGNDNVLTIRSLPLGTHTVGFHVENNQGITSRLAEETVIVSLEYVMFNVHNETGLIVENGLCADGSKNCEKAGTIPGGGYYAKLGEKVALNGNPDVLSDLLLDERFTDYHTIGQGGIIELQSGYSLSVQEIDIQRNEVMFSLTQDGAQIFNPVVKIGSLFTFTKSTLGGESDVPVIVFSVDNVFTGMEYDYVIISGIWMISTNV